MKALNIITLVLIIVGGVNWALHALNANIVDAIFGVDSVVTNAVYVLVGLSAIVQLITIKQAAKQYS